MLIVVSGAQPMLCQAILDLRDGGLLKTEQEHRYAQARYVLTRALAKLALLRLLTC